MVTSHGCRPQQAALGLDRRRHPRSDPANSGQRAAMPVVPPNSRRLFDPDIRRFGLGKTVAAQHCRDKPPIHRQVEKQN
jgi:hypothetical protein